MGLLDNGVEYCRWSYQSLSNGLLTTDTMQRVLNDYYATGYNHILGMKVYLTNRSEVYSLYYINQDAWNVCIIFCQIHS